ncbi:MAG: PadR family transcriptional regulator [Candidatus Micrarchaeota archaeon]
MKCCDMKGFLSYLILWNLSQGKKNGAEISKDLQIRRGSKPSPGTLYPALKELKEKGMVSCDKKKYYSLTKRGKKELNEAGAIFCKIFHDMPEMFKCCCKGR